MSERTTAEIVADLWSITIVDRDASEKRRAAADRLEALDAEVAERDEALMAQAAIGADLAAVALDALRPPCPTCGGDQRVVRPNDSPIIRGNFLDPCPDCKDGKTPIERMVRVFTALHAEQAYTDVPAAILAYLRSIR